MTAGQITELLGGIAERTRSPHAARIVATAYQAATLELDATERHLRPGGTVSGPTLMYLADFAMYTALIAGAGPAGAAAVTTNLNIHFLSRTGPGLIRAEARLLKLGRRLATGDVSITDAGGKAVAHATCTYALAAD
jgi:uncharacterized protein (TIGR00369 family)